ncbi:hypothetical protein [Draconibacterium orientale]|uniref:hypothetical protein n=1 Tax=Draconibacterium orientale TaxID=1168034 RepID=UPI0029C0CB99|nr:hypothetical protein [Draconibacterium orientale]
MDINNLIITPSAQIFKIVKRVSLRQLNNLFKDCSEKRIGNFIINEKKVALSVDEKSVIYSVMAFRMQSQPNFLINTSVKEIRYAYLLIIEYEEYAFIFKKHIDNPQNKMLNYLNPFPYEKLTGFKASDETEYEKVSMNSMTISNAVIRNRAFEGKNLNGLLPSTSASRSIANSFRLNSEGEIYSIVPNTSRLSFRSSKLSIEELSQWCITIAEELDSQTKTNSFINNFASPVNLEKISKTSSPSAILLDLEELDYSIREQNTGKTLVYIDKDENPVYFTTEQLKTFFNLFKSPINLIKNNSKDGVYDFSIRGTNTLGSIRLNKNTISLFSKVGNNIIISDNNEGNISFSKYINSNKPFSVVFDNPSYMYFSRYTFEDKKLLSNIEGMLSIFIDSYDFSNVRTEKEKPYKNTISEFPINSLFYAVEDNLRMKDSIIICDDMNDEWADHIVIERNTTPPSISYVHSKYIDKESYGASKFHEVVSQALKNIGRLNSDSEEYKVKYDNEWKNKYESTQIERIRTGNSWDEIESSLKAINSNPNSIRKVVLATPFLKKSVLKTKMEQLARGEDCPAHYVQILWLINTFISACRDYNVQPYILCKS